MNTQGEPMADVTNADRGKAMDIIAEYGHGDPDPFGEIQEAIAKALAEERGKARAQVASDLVDLVTDSMNAPSRDALVDFIYALEAK